MSYRNVTLTALGLTLVAFTVAAAVEDPKASINLFVTEPSYLGADDPAFETIDRTPCADLVSEPIEGLVYVWVVASREGGFVDDGRYGTGDEGISLLHFGIEHSGVALVGYATTTGLSSIFHFGFPDSGGSCGISWSEDECYVPPGNSARAGLFVVADGTVGRMQITDPTRRLPATWYDCSGRAWEIPPENLGQLVLGVTTDPRCGDTLSPVDEVSWSTIRGFYRR